jgi:uncharacterized RDD family membrane protein YckC
MLDHADLVQIVGNRVCADCKPAFLSRVMASGDTVTSKWHYAGFWIRVAARLVDGIAVGIVQASIALVFFGTFGAEFMPSVTKSAPIGLRVGYQFLSYAVAMVYEVVFLHYRGASLGKIALGLKVVRSHGGSLGWGLSVGRYFMYLVSGVILFIGYLMAGFDNEKRALHDRICNTRVIYKSSVS